MDTLATCKVELDQTTTLWFYYKDFDIITNIKEEFNKYKESSIISNILKRKLKENSGEYIKAKFDKKIIPKKDYIIFEISASKHYTIPAQTFLNIIKNGEEYVKASKSLYEIRDSYLYSGTYLD